MGSPIVVELPPSIPDAIPAPIAVLAPVAPSPAQPAAVSPAPAEGAVPATPVPTVAETAKLLSDALKAAQGETTPAPGAPAAPGTITIDPQTLPAELRAVWEQVGGDVAQFITRISALPGVPAQPPTPEPEPAEPELEEPPTVVAPPPLTEKLLNEIVARELARDPTYSSIDQAYIRTNAQIGKLDTEIRSHEAEITRITAGLSFPAMKDDPVLKSELETQKRDHREEVGRLKADRRDLAEKQAERMAYHKQQDADLRSRIIEDHRLKTREASSHQEFIRARDGYANEFVRAWGPAVQAAAVESRIPPEMVNEQAVLEADAKLIHGLALDDIPAFVKGVARKMASVTDVLGRVRAGTYAVAATARATAIAGPVPVAPSFVPAGPSPTPAQGAKPVTVADAIRNTDALLRQATRGGA